MLIPKIIHQTCPDKTKLHDSFLENIERLKSMSPDWEYRLYDHHDRREFISKHYSPDYLAAYDALQSDYGAAKADFFRYLVVYECGGAYLDIKSGTDLPLSNVLKDDDAYILAEWDNGVNGDYPGAGFWPKYGVFSEYQQWHVIAMPKHPFLRQVIAKVKSNIENYDPFKLGVGRIGTLRTTGPIAYTLAIQEVKNSHPHRVVKIKDLGIQYSFLKQDVNAHRLLIGSRYATTKQMMVNVPIITTVAYRLLMAFKSFLKNLEKITIRPLARKLKGVFSFLRKK